MPDRTNVATPAPSARPARRIAAQVAATYALATAVWILGTGYLVLLLPERIARFMEISKGLVFALVTTFMLYVVINRWADRFAKQAEVADIAERRLLQVVQAVPVGVMLAAADGTVEFLNPEGSRILGLSASSALGGRIENLVRPREGVSAGLIELLQTGRLDGLSIRGGGEESGSAFVVSSARLGTGESETGWVLAFADVTGTHLENERIRKLVQGYRVLADALHLIQTARDTRQLLNSVCEIVVDDGLLAGAWAAVPDRETGQLGTAAQCGLTPEVVERIEHVSHDIAERNLGDVAASLGDGDLYVVNDVLGDAVSPFQGLEGLVPFGSSATFMVTTPYQPLAVMTLFADEQGFFDQEQIRFIEILRDAIVFAVSKFELDAKRLEAEESLANSESAYRQMFNLNPAPMWVYDRSTLAFLAVNEAAVRKYGYSTEEFGRMTLLDIRPPEDIPRLLHSVAHQTPGLEDSGYWTHIDKSGHKFAVHVRQNCINWNGTDAQLALMEEVATIE